MCLGKLEILKKLSEYLAKRYRVVSGKAQMLILHLEHVSFLRAKAAMLSARLSHRNSVHPSVHLSVTWVDQAKTVHARISKFSPSSAWKTLVSGTVKLFRKFQRGHLERGR